MPPYAYSVHINRERELVWHRGDTLYPEDQSVEELIKDLNASLKGMPVSYVRSQLSVGFDGQLYVNYCTEETDEEYNSRIEKLEAYNREYNRRKNNA